MVAILEDKDYLQFYWDLASEDAQVRLSAGHKLVQYLKDHIISKNDQKIITEYKDYTLKRLVRGLASPRDFARQGFATALCEVLNTFTYTIEEVLKLIDENTQTTGSLKGSEERDNMFGKLFGYAAILRSNLVAKNKSKKLKEQLLSLVDRIVELHSKKVWIQESTIEILLVLLQQVQENAVNDSLDNEFKQNLLNKMIALTNTSSFEENNENQLSMLLALQHMTRHDASLKKILQSLLTSLQIPEITIQHMFDFKDALFHSTNKFPKIHKVWDYFMGLIVPLNAERDFSERPNSLTNVQQEALQQYVHFLDEEMRTSTKEKRSTAMKLSVRLASVVPADCIPIVLSEDMIRSLALSRLKTKNLLFDFAGGILKDLVHMVEGDKESTLSLLVALSQHGGMNFDKRTSSTTVQALLQSMEYSAIQEYIKLLCGIIASYDGSVAAQDDKVNTAMDVDGDGDGDDGIEEKTHPAMNAIHALITLARLPSITNKEKVQLAVLGILSRVACFTSGHTKDAISSSNAGSKTPADKKKKKTDKKKEEPASSSSSASSIDRFVIECIQSIESGSLSKHIPEEMVTIASSQLAALVSDVASKSGQASSQMLPNGEEQQPQHLVLYDVWTLLHHCIVVSGLTSRHHAKAGDDEDDDDMGGDSCMTTNISLPQFMDLVHQQIQQFMTVLQQAVQKEDLKRLIRFAESSVTLLIVSTLHVLTTKDMEKEVCLQAAIVLKELLLKAQNNSFGVTDEEEEEEEDDEDDSLELRLLETCIDFLSLPNDAVIKGLRDSIKRVWNSLIPLIGDENLSQSFIDSLVGQVTDPDNDNNNMDQFQNDQDQDHEEEDDGMDDEDEIEADEEDDEEDEEEQVQVGKKRKTAASSSKKDKKALKADKIAAKQKQMQEEVEAEEDILVQEDDMFDFLMVDDEALNAELGLNGEDEDENSDDDEGALMHTEEADAALINMIKARKENRKEGLLAAKRKQILLRSRLLDILEILVNRIRSGTILFSLYTPLILGMKKVVTSKMLLEIAEGKPFIQRLQNLITNQLCKKKFSLKIAEDGDLVVECNEELDILMALHQKLLSSKLVPLRQLSQETSLSIARAMISSDSASSQEKIKELFQQITEAFLHKRRSQIPKKWLEDTLVHRFPHFFLPTLWPTLLQGLQSSKIVYVRHELNEMVVTVLKKWSSLTEEVREVIASQVVAFVNSVQHNLAEAISSSKDKEETVESEKKEKKQKKPQHKSKDQAARLMKVSMTSVKAMLDTIHKAKKDHHAALMNSIKSKSFATSMKQLKTTLAQCKEVLTATNNTSAISVLDQCVQSINSLVDPAVVSAEESSKKTSNKDKEKKEKEKEIKKGKEAPSKEEVKESPKEEDKESKKKAKKQKTSKD